MNANQEWNEFVQPDKTPAPPKKTGIPKIAWLVGCGCVSLLTLGVIAAIIGFAIYTSRMSDPITSRVPDSSMVYMSVDFQQAQSGNLEKIATVFQKIAGVDQPKSMVELLDEALKQVDMTFKDDLLPWMGTHGSIVVTHMTYGSSGPSDVELMMIVEARNTTGADVFIKKWVKVMADKNNIEMTDASKNGVIMYVGKSGSQPVVIARSGNFVYIANSESAINESIGLSSQNSLANSKAYKSSITALPSNRLATLFVSGDAYSEFVKQTAQQSGLGSSFAGSDLGGKGLLGVVMSASAEDVGLRLNAAVAYDQSKLGDFEKKAFSTTYQNPTIDKLVPDDTFFFMAVNSSQKLGAALDKDNPAYTTDVQESIKLLDDSLGFSIKELLDLFGGEFGFAIGPATDGLMPDAQKMKVGFSVLASTADEKAFESWVGSHLDILTSKLGIKVSAKEAQFGSYSLQELSTDSLGGNNQLMPVLYYGGAQGHAIIASSKDNLSKVLGNNQNLANNTIYRNTWKSFPSGSKPMIYAYLPGILNLIKDPSFGGGSSTLGRGWEQIPVIAVAMTNSPAFTQSYSMIFFIDTSK